MICRTDSVELRRRALDRQFARQAQHGAAGRWIRKRCPISSHFLVVQLTQDRVRYDPFDEDVFLQDQPLADAFSSERPEQFAGLRLLMKRLISFSRTDIFHEGEAEHLLPIECGKVEGKRCSPILRDQEKWTGDHLFDEGFEIAELVEEGVVDVGLVGLAIADQIRCNAAPDRCHMRQDVPPDIGRRRVAVEKQDRRSRAFFDIGHRRSENVDE